MGKNIEKLVVIPINTSVGGGALHEVVFTLKKVYDMHCSEIELLPRQIIEPENHPELFHKEFGETYIGVDTNQFTRPAKIFQYLQIPGKRVLAMTDMPLYNPLFANDFHRGMNGMIEPECNAGIMTTQKIIGELTLTLLQKLNSLITNSDPSFGRRLRRLLTDSQNLFLDKLKSLAVHETGHFYELEHCMQEIPESGLLCAMAGSDYLALKANKIGWTRPHDYDLRGYSLCLDCRKELDS